MPAGEEEVELQELAQGQRLRLGAGAEVRPAVLGGGEQGELADAAVDEHVDGGVAVERGDEVLVGSDLPDRLGAAVVGGEDAGHDQLLQRAPDRRAVLEVERAGDPPAALVEVRRQRRHRLLHLGEGQRTVLAEDRHAHDGGRGHRGHPVEPVTHVERDPLDGVRRRGLVVGELSEALLERDRLPEVHVGAPEPPPLLAGELVEPAQVLRPLLPALRLVGHHRDLVQLVVDDRHRHQQRVGEVGVGDRVGDVPQDAERGRPQLPGAGAAALDRPRQVDPVAHQLGDVGAEREPVERLVAGAAADEDDARPAGERAHREEVQVRPAERVRRRDPPGGDHLGDQGAVQVGPVGEEEQQRVPVVEGAHPGHGLVVDVDVVGPGHPLPEPAERRTRAVAVRRRHLAEVRRRLGGGLLGSHALGLRERIQPGAEALVVEELGHLPPVGVQAGGGFAQNAGRLQHPPHVQAGKGAGCDVPRARVPHHGRSLGCRGRGVKGAEMAKAPDPWIRGLRCLLSDSTDSGRRRGRSWCTGGRSAVPGTPQRRRRAPRASPTRRARRARGR